MIRSNSTPLRLFVQAAAVALVAGLLVTGGGASVLPAGAATIMSVTTVSDVVADDGVCSLREAITAANTDSASGISAGECPAGSGADELTFGVAGPFVLASPLVVSSELAVSGSGATIDAEGSGSVVSVTLTGNVTFTLVTLTGGDSPGNGGGIDNAGTVTLVDSTVSGNNATFGGGILNTGTLNVTRSTISGNSTLTSGGGIANTGGTVTLSNATISANSAASGGGIGNGGGTMNVYFTTVTDNTAADGAGIWSNNTAGTFTNVAASVVADNEGNGGDVDYRDGTGNNSFSSGGFNVIGDGNATGVFAAVGVIGSGAGLGLLADNGGPTLTHLPQPASAAIDRVSAVPNPSSADVVADQRGVARPYPVGGAKDAGSVEVDAADLLDYCSGIFTWSVTTLGGLNFAIGCFNNATAPGVYNISVEADIAIGAAVPTTTIGNKTTGISLVVNGNGHTVDANGTSSVLEIYTPTGVAGSRGTTLTVENITLTGGNATNGGGIKNTNGDVTVSNSTITANTAGTSGGGISSGGAHQSLTVIDSTISDNQAPSNGSSGGGIAARRLTVVRSTVTGNSATWGGGIQARGPTTILNSTISGNSARNGGGLNVGGSTTDGTSVLFSTITGNTGTGVSVGYGSAMISGSIVSGNTGSAGDIDSYAEVLPPERADESVLTSGGFNVIGSGGAIGVFNQPGDVTSVAAPGLGPLADNGGPTLTHLLLPGSPAIDRVTGAVTPPSGAVAEDQRGLDRPFPLGEASDSGSVELQVDYCAGITSWSVSTTDELNNALDCFNRATAAGVYQIDATTDITLASPSTPIDNAEPGVSLVVNGNDRTLDANGTSSVLTVSNGEVTVRDLTLTGGDASSGGGISNAGTLTVVGATITENSAGFGSGGGIFNNGGSLTVESSTITGNDASIFGGGVASIGGSMSAVNTVVSDNEAALQGGGVHHSSTPSSVLTNVSIFGNRTGGSGGGIYNNSSSPAIGNSIMWGNTITGTATPSNVSNAGASSNPTFHNSLIEGSGGSGAGWLASLGSDLGGNLDTDPLFADSGGRLAAGSPAIDSGLNALVPAGITTDLDGNERFAGVVDIGAFERERDGVTILASPCLVFDSTAAAGSGGTFTGGENRTIQVTGPLSGQRGAASCVPAGASAALFRVSSINPLTEGNLKMGAAGEPGGGAGVVNYGAANGLNNANTVTVPLSAGGAVDVSANAGGLTAATTDVRLVVIGFYAPDAGGLTYFPLEPCAVADSRPATGADDIHDGPFGDGLWPAGDDYPDIDVVAAFPAGQGGGNTDCNVPAGADAVMVNIVAVNATGAPGHLSAGPGGLDPSDEAVAPFAVLDPKMNNAATTIIRLDGQETIAIDVDGPGSSTMIRVVVLGYYDDDPSGLDYSPVAPCAAFDSRANNGATGIFAGERGHGPAAATTYQIAGEALPAGQGGVIDQGSGAGTCGVPDGSTAVLINLVAINALREGNVRAYTLANPTTGGVLNFADLTPKMNNSNAVVVPLSEFGELTLEINAGGATPAGTPVAHARGIILGFYD